MAPVEIFSDFSQSTGVITRSNAPLALAAEKFGLTPQEVTWYNLDIAIIRHRARMLGMDTEDGRSAAELLQEIEVHYYRECIAAYSIPLEAATPTEHGWGEIQRAHDMGVVDAEDDKRRMATARALQLNKFRVPWEEIEQESYSLGFVAQGE